MVRMKHNGFTLLEMVVAISIFSIIAALSYSALNNFLDARDHITTRSDEIASLQRVFILLERDLRHVVPRPVRDGFGDSEAAVVSRDDDPLAVGELIRFTTIQSAPSSHDLHQLKRAAWRLSDGILSRISWRVLDRDQDSVEYERQLFHGVAGVDITFYTYDDEDDLQTSSTWEGDSRNPEGVEVILLMDSGIEYRRFFQLVNG